MMYLSKYKNYMITENSKNDPMKFIMEESKNLEQNLDKSNEKLHISDVSDSYNDEWVLFLDEFRKTDSYRKSNGQLLFPKFFEWLSLNYEIPKKKIV